MTAVLVLIYLLLVKLLYKWALGGGGVETFEKRGQSAPQGRPRTAPLLRATACHHRGRRRRRAGVFIALHAPASVAQPSRADASAVYGRAPRQRPPGLVSDARLAAGDRPLLAAADADGGARGRGAALGRAYQPEGGPARPGERPLMDDLAWYEGRYPDEDGGGGGGATRRRGGPPRSFLPPADDP
jgi:hypothetical protein